MGSEGSEGRWKGNEATMEEGRIAHFDFEGPVDVRGRVEDLNHVERT